MKVIPYTPASGELKSNDLGALLFNQVASTVYEDTGRDAQHLSDTLGLTVLAADRPGSGITWPSRSLRRRLSDDYIGEMASLAPAIESECALSGLKRIIAVGRSAGGTGALALTAAEALPITGVYAAEPVGMQATSVRQGKRDYSNYLKRQSAYFERQTDDDWSVRPEPSDVHGLSQVCRLASIPLSFLNDTFHNEVAWSQPVALAAAEHIALEQPSVAAVVEFAHVSMTADQPLIDVSKDSLPELRKAAAAGSAETTAAFEVRQIYHTFHASFDNRGFFDSRVQRLIDSSALLTREPRP
ncbi:MAG TPA: hypothetical protein VF572_02480 [Candidatus Saccharimonadales bacterium]|jgi:pimeloyl-ACP methyl ester carboxylesterase